MNVASGLSSFNVEPVFETIALKDPEMCLEYRFSNCHLHLPDAKPMDDCWNVVSAAALNLLAFTAVLRRFLPAQTGEEKLVSHMASELAECMAYFNFSWPMGPIKDHSISMNHSSQCDYYQSTSLSCNLRARKLRFALVFSGLDGVRFSLPLCPLV